MNYKYTGLSSRQAEESRKQHGDNLVTPPKKESIWKLIIDKFQDPIIRVLLIAAFLSLILGVISNHYIETIGIFAAIFLATGIAFWFEYDAKKRFDILNQVNDDTLVKVFRNGLLLELPKREIVVGDIVVIETGDEIPADGKLLETISLQVNESTLTGEPIISKSYDPAIPHRESTYPVNWVYRGTTVVEGHGVFEVAYVGDNTEYGKVAKASTIDTEEDTPLNKQLKNLAKVISFIGFTIAAIVFSSLLVNELFFSDLEYDFREIALFSSLFISVFIAVSRFWMPILFDGFSMFNKHFRTPGWFDKLKWRHWILIGASLFTVLCIIALFFGVKPWVLENWINLEQAENILQFFMIAVTLIVVAVPEGLPMSVTLSLALSMKKMLKTNNLVRKMHACETLGATTVICTDKTGTLTQNLMQVAEVEFLPVNSLSSGENGYGRMIIENIAANSTADLNLSDEKNVKTIGNPTEGALLLYLYKNDIDYLAIRDETTVVEQLPFSTERKYMATLVHSSLLNKKIIYVKGAPEVILHASKKVQLSDRNAEIGEYKEQLIEHLTQYQEKAMRTLAFAYQIVPEGEQVDLHHLSACTLLGFVAIADPVRPEVADAVKHCRDAGINIKIVTGDTSITAVEIGKQIGLLPEKPDYKTIMTGNEFEDSDDKTLLDRLPGLSVLARAKPNQKQRLVKLLQSQGEVVAVTGDGTNDAPALNYAHVGLSMGSGTSIAKEASDVTLLDDSFGSIVSAILWGRSLYKNIQRFILFQLTINVAAMMIVFFGTLFGTELPLTVTQMLWVNLIMDTFAAGALASLPPENNLMKEKPRKSSAFIVTRPMRLLIFAVGSSFVVILLLLLSIFNRINYVSPAYELSFFFTFFVMLQYWNLFNAKAFGSKRSAFYQIHKSKPFLLVSVIILIGQFLIVQFGGPVFRTEPLLLKDWLIIFFSTSLILVIGEIVRFVRYRR